MTAKTLIQAAYRLLGNLRHGQTASDDALTDGLSMLNDMLDAWAVERLTIPVIARNEVALVAAQQTYFIGTGGDWVIQRPTRIERCGYISNSVETPIEVLTVQRWAEITSKSMTGAYPRGVYFDGDAQLMRAQVFPVPTDSSVTLALYGWQPFQAFADIDTTNYDFPPGVSLALRYCLAELLIPEAVIQNKAAAPQFQHIIAQAQLLKGKWKSFNAPMAELGFDRSLLGRGYFDIQTGGYA